MTRRLNIPKLSPSVIAEDLLEGLKNNQYEIHSGEIKDYYKQFLVSPEKAFLTFNGVIA